MTGPTGGMNEIKTECERWGWQDDEAEVGSIGAVRCGGSIHVQSRLSGDFPTKMTEDFLRWLEELYKRIC